MSRREVRGVGVKLTRLLQEAAAVESVPATHFGAGKLHGNRTPTMLCEGLVEWVPSSDGWPTVTSHLCAKSHLRVTEKGRAYLRTKGLLTES